MINVRADLDNHLRTSSHISQKTADKSVNISRRRLGANGIIGLLRYDSPNERDPRYDLFKQNLRQDSTDLGNGIYVPEVGILVVHGQEVLTEEGFDIHVVGHDSTQTIPVGTPMPDLIKRANDLGAIKIVAAPYHADGAGKYLEKHPELLEGFDGVEIFSGSAELGIPGKFHKANRKAMKAFPAFHAHNPNLFRTVGSDGHSIEEIGRTYAEIPMKTEDYANFAGHPEKLVEELRAGLKHASDRMSFHRTPARKGAINHILDLVAIIGTSKFGLDPNTQLAPTLERLGIQI